MTIVETRSSNDVGVITKRVYKNNTKDRLAFNMAKVINLACADDKMRENKELWAILHQVL